MQLGFLTSLFPASRGRRPHGAGMVEIRDISDTCPTQLRGGPDRGRTILGVDTGMPRGRYAIGRARCICSRSRVPRPISITSIQRSIKLLCSLGKKISWISGFRERSEQEKKDLPACGGNPEIQEICSAQRELIY